METRQLLLSPYTYDAGCRWITSWYQRNPGKHYRRYWERGHTEWDYMDEPMHVTLIFRPKKFCPTRIRLFRGHRIRVVRRWLVKPGIIYTRCNGCGMCEAVTFGVNVT